MISGQVLLEDGTPPTESVVIERVCNSSPHAEGYTDSKGYFTIELGRSRGMMQDASETGGFADALGGGMMTGSGAGSTMGGAPGTSGTMQRSPELQFANCELRARLAGYRSQVVSLANRRALDNPDIGVILLHRVGQAEAGDVVSASALAAPKDAKKAYDKAQEFAKKKKFDDAVKSLEKAVELYPHYAIAWYDLGRLQLMQGDKWSAKGSFQSAIKADPKYAAPYVDLAVFELEEHRWAELAKITEQGTKADSFAYPQLFFLNAVANYNLKNMEAAEKSARRAEILDTRHQYPKNSHLLGTILLQHQDYTAAAAEFRSYLKFAPTAPDATQVRAQLEQMEKISAQSRKDEQ